VIVDAHVHPARLATLKLPWDTWLGSAADRDVVAGLYDPDGVLVADRFDALFEAEGVDRALLFCEYSPRVTGVQAIEDMLPIVAGNPERFRIVANVNPHLHYPVDAEVRRQLDLGAVALKVHPVHGGFSPADRELYDAYAVCAERGVPVILHSGTSSFPGARARFGDPALMNATHRSGMFLMPLAILVAVGINRIVNVDRSRTNLLLLAGFLLSPLAAVAIASVNATRLLVMLPWAVLIAVLAVIGYGTYRVLARNSDHSRRSLR